MSLAVGAGSLWEVPSLARGGLWIAKPVALQDASGALL